MHVHIQFTHSAIVAPEVRLASREVGAVAEFSGIVREQEGDRILEGLFYEAYLPMACKQLDRIFRELQGTYPCACVEFVHRLGWVPVNEASLWIRIQSSHRGEAFGMLAESVRRMKADVPIWKSLRPRAEQDSQR